MSEVEVSPRFNQRTNEPYGHCVECEGLTFETSELASAHMHETFETRTAGSAGHRIRVTNQARPARIESAVGQIIQDAIDDAISSISDLTYGRRGGLPDATEAEITEAISRCYDGFAEAWGEYLGENAEDES